MLKQPKSRELKDLVKRLLNATKYCEVNTAIDGLQKRIDRLEKNLQEEDVETLLWPSLSAREED